MSRKLLADDDAWARAGEELKRYDPGRYLAILQIVEDICAIHRDPLRAERTAGHFLFQRTKLDDDAD